MPATPDQIVEMFTAMAIIAKALEPQARTQKDLELIAAIEKAKELAIAVAVGPRVAPVIPKPDAPKENG